MQRALTASDEQSLSQSELDLSTICPALGSTSVQTTRDPQIRFSVRINNHVHKTMELITALFTDDQYETSR